MALLLQVETFEQLEGLLALLDKRGAREGPLLAAIDSVKYHVISAMPSGPISWPEDVVAAQPHQVEVGIMCWGAEHGPGQQEAIVVVTSAGPGVLAGELCDGRLHAAGQGGNRRGPRARPALPGSRRRRSGPPVPWADRDVSAWSRTQPLGERRWCPVRT